jgi:hypothetical protein
MDSASPRAFLPKPDFPGAKTQLRCCCPWKVSGGSGRAPFSCSPPFGAADARRKAAAAPRRPPKPWLIRGLGSAGVSSEHKNLSTPLVASFTPWPKRDTAPGTSLSFQSSKREEGAGGLVQRAGRGQYAVGVYDDGAGARGRGDAEAGGAGGGGHVHCAARGKHAVCT